MAILEVVQEERNVDHEWAEDSLKVETRRQTDPKIIICVLTLRIQQSVHWPTGQEKSGRPRENSQSNDLSAGNVPAEWRGCDQGSFLVMNTERTSYKIHENMWLTEAVIIKTIWNHGWIMLLTHCIVTCSGLTKDKPAADPHKQDQACKGLGDRWFHGCGWETISAQLGVERIRFYIGCRFLTKMMSQKQMWVRWEVGLGNGCRK
jgi:hypothetical protein